MTLADTYREAWSQTDLPDARPSYARGVRKVTFDYLSAKLNEAPGPYATEFASDFVSSIFNGTIWIIRGAFSAGECQHMANTVHAFGQSQPPSFHKMLDGVPNFHRIIDSANTTAYSVTSLRHGYYFFRHNGAPGRLYEMVTPIWRVFKTLCGLVPDAYETAKPSDGVIERLVLYSYPRGGGHLGTHIDPINNQRLVMGCTMSTRGADFRRGGLYAIGVDGQKIVDLEEHMRAGDVMLCYPTVQHGVAPIDVEAPLDWDTIEARWFLGFSIVDSDHVSERVTARRAAE